MNNSFDPKNPRVKKAHKKHVFHNTPFFAINLVFFFILLAGGIALIVLHMPICWTLIGFSIVPLMFFYWAKNGLADVPTLNTTNFTDLISEDLLLLLNDKMTPANLIEVLPRSNSASFLMARFGLPPSLFQQVSQYLPATTEPIYDKAKQIREKTNSAEITGAVLAVAIIESGKKPVHSGGIARDLAFGFTPTLQQFAVNLSSRYVGFSNKVQQAENADILKKIIDTFTHEGRQNIALVGAYGSGRSTIVNSFAETLMNADSKIPSNLKFRQIYALDAPSLISAAKNQGELEYLMIKIMNEIYSAKNIILCLDNAHLFFEEGPGSVDITNLLVPILEAGRIRMILIMDDQKFLEISAKNPILANSLNKIVVNPSTHEETIKILMDQAPFIEHQKNVIFTYQSLTEAYRLSEQYIHDIEMPGKAKLLLEASASYANNRLVTAESVQTAVEKSYGVKVKVAEDDTDREKLLSLENLIHQRMIDQEEAVSAVSNALRRAAAGVKNQGRPIGTFLFLGPTGVGKTELAKALSEVYFDGEDNIIRLDMNEFVSANDVNRLIRDGASDALSLTAQVMKQPFSVILLDEIEKAHPSVLTTLLQVLDEGILRDEKNREVSFRDSIIIATSNAGANTIREQITAGHKIEEFKEQIIDELINQNEFKPEFLNRFDEICLFKPLSKDDLVKVLDLIIASTNTTTKWVPVLCVASSKRPSKISLPPPFYQALPPLVLRSLSPNPK